VVSSLSNSQIVATSVSVRCAPSTGSTSQRNFCSSSESVGSVSGGSSAPPWFRRPTAGHPRYRPRLRPALSPERLHRRPLRFLLRLCPPVRAARRHECGAAGLDEDRPRHRTRRSYRKREVILGFSVSDGWRRLRAAAALKVRTRMRLI